MRGWRTRSKPARMQFWSRRSSAMRTDAALRAAVWLRANCFACRRLSGYRDRRQRCSPRRWRGHRLSVLPNLGRCLVRCTGARFCTLPSTRLLANRSATGNAPQSWLGHLGTPISTGLCRLMRCEARTPPTSWSDLIHSLFAGLLASSAILRRSRSSIICKSAGENRIEGFFHKSFQHCPLKARDVYQRFMSLDRGQS